MHIALVSDIHGNLPALEAVAADLRRRGVDRVLVLGDNLSGPLLPKETAQYLMASGWFVLAGNHERQVLAVPAHGGGASDTYTFAQLGAAELAWVASLRPMAPLDDDVYLCHGTPRSDCEHFLDSVRGGVLAPAHADEIAERLGTVDAALVACGHSHVPRTMRSVRGALLVNPGSVGLQAYVDDEPERYVVELGTPDAHYAIVERRDGRWHAAIHAVPYDAAPMAALARARGRPDWAHALEHGRVG